MTAYRVVPDLTLNNPENVVFVSGDVASDEGWRLVVSGTIPNDQLSIQHYEPLTETGITLDDAKVATVEAGGYTDENTYYATVATDNRGGLTTPGGISGDMTGRMIEFNGFIWHNHTTQWVEKANFKHSMFSDRGIFQRMNVIDTDPDDHTKHPPAPTAGTAIGGRNTSIDGTGAEMLAITSQDGVSGMIPAIIHESSGIPVTPNQAAGLKADGFPVVFNYENAFLSNVPLFYGKGARVTHVGVRYVCNANGVQDGEFDDFADRWDPELVLPNFDLISTGLDHSVTVDRNGDIVYGRADL